MNFSLSYSGSPGNISATLTTTGKTWTVSNLADGKAAKKWAKGLAKEYRESQKTQEFKSEVTTVHISGSAGFSV